MKRSDRHALILRLEFRIQRTGGFHHIYLTEHKQLSLILSDPTFSILSEECRRDRCLGQCCSYSIRQKYLKLYARLSWIPMPTLMTLSCTFTRLRMKLHQSCHSY